MNKSREMLDLLAHEGYRPIVDDGERGATVHFKSLGDRMAFEFMDNDPTYVRLRASYTVEGHDRNVVASAINAINLTYKSIKATIDEDRPAVTFAVEAWYGELAHLAPLVGRWIALVNETSNELYVQLHRTAAAGTGAAR